MAAMPPMDDEPDQCMASAAQWLVGKPKSAIPPKPSGAVWRIVDIGFLPEARGRGLGSAMLGWIKDTAAASGAEGVVLQVAANNPLARALYLRAGFLDDGPAEGFHQPMAWRV